MKGSFLAVLTFSACAFSSACETSQAEGRDSRRGKDHKIVVTRPVARDVVSTQRYVCQIHEPRQQTSAELAKAKAVVKARDIRSTLSDSRVMWVYFNVPEALYLQYKIDKDELGMALKLASGETFPYPGKIDVIEDELNHLAGDVALRIDFPNPENLLRHDQTGTVLISRKLHDATVIPQRATYEILPKTYVYVVEPDKNGEPAAEPIGKRSAGSRGHGVVRQREIVIQDEADDIFVIKDGLSLNDEIIFEGTRQVRDGDRVEYVREPPEKILAHLKYHAE